MNTTTRIAVVGSTGSIGRQTLDVARSHRDRLDVVALAANRSRDAFTRQVAEFRPKTACLAGDPEWTAPHPARTVRGAEGLVEMVTGPDVDLVVFASSGHAGFRPLLAAIGAGKRVALANKEALVMAGELVLAAAAAAGTTIRPVDSEHSAIWQCLEGERHNTVRSLILTASGGPFREWSVERLRSATVADALRHPTWSMGSKITVDSATLMNKGLELIEAHWLFGVPYDRIDVVVHPQSIVHSMVAFRDGAIKAQLGTADMRTPIQYALSWPDRWETFDGVQLDLAELGTLHFERPDVERFPCLRLARQAGEAGGTYPTALCAADEVAVASVLEGSAPLSSIARTVDAVLQRHSNCVAPTIDDILAADRWARDAAVSALALV